jgi:hypothetical protein
VIDGARALYAWQYRSIAAALAVGLVLVFALWAFPAAAARSGSVRNKVLDLQRAYTVPRFTAVLKAWSDSNPDAIGIIKRESIVKLDLIFPALYAFALAFAYAALSGRREARHIDVALVILPFAAAALDYVENGLHLLLLSGVNTKRDLEAAVDADAFTPSLVLLASLAAHTKYLLLLLSLAGIVAALVRRVIGRAAL